MLRISKIQAHCFISQLVTVVHTSRYTRLTLFVYQSQSRRFRVGHVVERVWEESVTKHYEHRGKKAPGREQTEVATRNHRGAVNKRAVKKRGVSRASGDRRGRGGVLDRV
jgi:hypothetical protein